MMCFVCNKESEFSSLCRSFSSARMRHKLLFKVGQHRSEQNFTRGTTQGRFQEVELKHLFIIHFNSITKTFLVQVCSSSSALMVRLNRQNVPFSSALRGASAQTPATGSRVETLCNGLKSIKKSSSMQIKLQFLHKWKRQESAVLHQTAI